MKTPDLTETRIQANIVQALTVAGYWVIRSGVSQKRGKRGTQSGEPGQPDLCLPELGWLEVKRPGEILSEDQMAWHIRAQGLGVNVGVVTSPQQAIKLVESWRAEKREADPHPADPLVNGLAKAVGIGNVRRVK